MLRQTTSRNQRAKGFKVKQTLQILLLIAICIWLLYQVKHSHDKKRALDEKNLNFLSKEQESQVMPLRLGRKDLPGDAQIDSTSEIHDEEEEKEEKEEPGEEEEEQEQEPKQEDPEDEDGRAAGDDVIDDKDQYRGDEEAEQGEESADEEEKHGEESADEEEKQREESADDEEEKQREESADEEEKQGEGEEMDSMDDQDKERDSQQAREEHYRRDDVAGSVLPDTQMTKSEPDEAETKRLDDDNTGGTNEKEEETENLANGEMDVPKGETVNNSKDNLSGIGQRENEIMPIENASVNATAAEKNELVGRAMNSEERTISNSTTDGSNGQIGNSTKVTESDSQVKLHSNSTTATVSDNQMELQTNAMVQMGTQSKPGVVDVVTHDAPLQNGTTSQDPGQNNETTDNSNPENVVMEQSETSNMSTAVHTEDNSTSFSVVHQNGDSVQETENNNTSLSDVHKDDDSVQGQPNNGADLVITEEEKAARTDLSTLADTQTIANPFEEEAVE